MTEIQENVPTDILCHISSSVNPADFRHIIQWSRTYSGKSQNSLTYTCFLALCEYIGEELPKMKVA